MSLNRWFIFITLFCASLFKQKCRMSEMKIIKNCFYFFRIQCGGYPQPPITHYKYCVNGFHLKHFLFLYLFLFLMILSCFNPNFQNYVLQRKTFSVTILCVWCLRHSGVQNFVISMALILMYVCKKYQLNASIIFALWHFLVGILGFIFYYVGFMVL